MTNVFFDSAGVSIRYLERGEGEPIVLVHSYTGDLESQWRATGVLEHLARHYRVIAFDARGHGRSGKPHEPQAYGAQMAWDVVRLLDHLRLARAHVVGYSMGAHLVALLLTLAPERFITATLGGAAGRRNWSRDDDIRVEREAREIETGLLASQILRLLPPTAPVPSAAELKALSDAFLDGEDRLALAAIRRSNSGQAVTSEQLAQVRVPVLGLVGSADPYRASFEALRTVMPRLELVLLEGATHLSAPAHPEFAPAIEAFLHRHPGAGGSA